MNIKMMKQTIVSLLLISAASQSQAVVFDLCADTTTKTMPDGEVVTMWGYGLDTGGACAPTVPGPELVVPIGDTDITVNLRNDLAESISMVISGQQAAMTPVFFTDNQGRQRVRSFTHETASGAVGVYNWNNVKSGSFLYSSGTHPAVQVQMGLYGAISQDASTGQAYSGISFDETITLLYSEIDSGIHNAVANGNYGPGRAVRSTINYSPNYFMVNGEVFDENAAALSVGSAGERILIRMLNAGLEDHSMQIQGAHLSMVAEDGNAYPWAREQHTFLMAAGKAKDAIFEPSSTGTYALYDRRLNVGMMSQLSVGSGVPGPTAVADSSTVDEDSTVNISVLNNDLATISLDVTSVAIEGAANNGQATANADGTIDYAPSADFSGSDSFSYSVRDINGVRSNNATVSMTISAVNDTPVLTDDSLTAVENTANNILDVLINDSDIDGDLLTITSLSSLNNGGTATTDGTTISYSPLAAFVGDESFTYSVDDGSGNIVSANVVVTVTAAPVSNTDPVAIDDNYTVEEDSTNTVLDVLINDSDADADALTITTLSSPNNGGTVTTDGSTLTYSPLAGFVGDESFTYNVDDGNGGIATATVIVTVTALPNTAPVAVGDNFDVVQDTAGNALDVLLNDTDADIDTLTITVLSTPNNGGTVTTDGITLSYSPLVGFVGIETFTYDADDGNGGTSTATVTINVTANTVVNVAPVAVDDDAVTLGNRDAASNNSVTFDVVINDTDDDGTITASSVTFTTNPLMGVLINNGDGTVTYTPNPGQLGSDAINYTVTDDQGAVSNEATIRIDIVRRL